jgi:hypothetical protein
MDMSPGTQLFQAIQKSSARLAIYMRLAKHPLPPNAEAMRATVKQIELDLAKLMDGLEPNDVRRILSDFH